MTPGPDVDISPAYALHRCPLKPKAVRYPVQWCNLPHIKDITEHQNAQVLLKRGEEDPPSNKKLRYSRPPKKVNGTISTIFWGIPSGRQAWGTPLIYNIVCQKKEYCILFFLLRLNMCTCSLGSNAKCGGGNIESEAQE